MFRNEIGQWLLIQTHHNSGSKFHRNLPRISEHEIWRLAEATYALCVHFIHSDGKHINLIGVMNYLRIEQLSIQRKRSSRVHVFIVAGRWWEQQVLHTALIKIRHLATQIIRWHSRHYVADVV
jgi:hypothetical protein